ncbi:MAG: TonB-dependent receptor [Bryobacteraceae bacterium]|nr:TonB-dependent receptor [Bryobacteraceae bacterium]
MTYLKVARAASLVALLTLSGVSLRAQSIYGGVRGLVADAQGGVIGNAKVTLTDEGTGFARSTVSNSLGEYTFASVTPATYMLVAESPGFKRFERRGVIVATQQFVTLDLKLEVGNVTESVMVTEEVPLLETSNASQGQSIDRQKLIDLPNLGRNPFMMSRLAPTVQQVGNPAYNRMQDQSGSSAISINGGPVRGNNYLIDGIPITDFSNRAVIIPSLEAVEEVKVQIAAYDAENGRTGGGMFNTFMKSGTNTYHGSLFGYMRETEWLANLYFNNRAGRPISDQPFRNYGGSFGGKVWIPKVYDGKNKTFFWLGFEGYRDTQAASQRYYVPTALERTGNFSQSRTQAGALQTIYDPLTSQADGSRTPFAGNIIPTNRMDPVGRNIAASFANPTGNAAYFGDFNLFPASTLPSKADQYFAKLDHQVTSWWRASISYLKYNSIEPGEFNVGNISSPNQWTLERIVNATQINNTMTLSPTTVLAVRYGFNRFPNIESQKSAGFNVASLGFSQTFLNGVTSPVFPNVTMQTAHSLGTNSNGNYVHHSKNFGAQLSKFLGKHNVKVGYDQRRLHVDGIQLGNSAGAFTFNNTFTRANANTNSTSGSDIASLLLGAPAGATGFVSTKLFQYIDYYAWYIHDDFRVTNRLTLNLGLRWERETGLRETNDNLITGFDPAAPNPIGASSGYPTFGVFRFAGVNGQKVTTGDPNLNKFSPRIGFAYQLNDKTVIRGGYGIFWAPNFPLGGPLTSEGITATTTPAVSNDGNKTPAIQLSNPWPNGLDRPVGSSLGPLTGIGKSLSILDPNARSPRVQQYSIDIQRQLPGGINFSVGYSGSRTNNLTWTTAGLNINQLDPSNFSRGVLALNSSVANPYYQRGGSNGVGNATITQNQLLRPYAAFTGVTLVNSDRNRARYDSAVLRAQKAMSNGLTFVTAYTWSKNFDMSGGGAGNNLNGGNSGPQDVFSLDGEYGLSYLHSPHRWTNAITYELPFGRGKAFLGSANYATNLLLGGWSFNVVSTIQTGYPLQIFQDQNNNASFGNARQRPNATGVSPETSGSFGQRIDNWINPAAFSGAGAASFGNVTRTIAMRGPGQVNWDASVFKTFAITERFKAQFRGEALNAMNTPWFRAPSTALGNAGFGRITQQANFPRMIQLGLRLYF